MDLLNGVLPILIRSLPILAILMFLDLSKIISRKLLVLICVILFFASIFIYHYYKEKGPIFLIAHATFLAALSELTSLIIRRFLSPQKAVSGSNMK